MLGNIFAHNKDGGVAHHFFAQRLREWPLDRSIPWQARLPALRSDREKESAWPTKEHSIAPCISFCYCHSCLPLWLLGVIAYAGAGQA